MSPLQRVKVFMKSVGKLRYDYEIYRCIDKVDWRSTVPRRQQVQQRQFLSDIYRVLPVVGLSMVPIVGYIPMFASVVFPRQLLSRQFYNTYECFSFGRIAHEQRRPYCQQLMKSSDESHLPTTALALGFMDSFPPYFGKILAGIMPSRLLERLVNTTWEQIGQDDLLLVKEGYIANNCNGLTDLEVFDACVLRGLPLKDDMRDVLTKHLTGNIDSELTHVERGKLSFYRAIQTS